MKVYSEWDDNTRTVIHTTHERDWTWAELHRHDEMVLTQMLSEVSHPVSIIVDMLNSPYFPAESFAEHIRRNSETYTRLNIQMVVFVIREIDIGQLLLSAHNRFGATNCTYCIGDSLEQARDFIAEHACL